MLPEARHNKGTRPDGRDGKPVNVSQVRQMRAEEIKSGGLSERKEKTTFPLSIRGRSEIALSTDSSPLRKNKEKPPTPTQEGVSKDKPTPPSKKNSPLWRVVGKTSSPRTESVSDSEKINRRNQYAITEITPLLGSGTTQFTEDRNKVFLVAEDTHYPSSTYTVTLYHFGPTDKKIEEDEKNPDGDLNVFIGSPNVHEIDTFDAKDPTVALNLALDHLNSGMTPKEQANELATIFEAQELSRHTRKEFNRVLDESLYSLDTSGAKK